MTYFFIYEAELSNCGSSLTTLIITSIDLAELAVRWQWLWIPAAELGQSNLDRIWHGVPTIALQGQCSFRPGKRNPRNKCYEKQSYNIGISTKMVKITRGTMNPRRVEQDPVSTMQKTSLTNYFSFLVWKRVSFMDVITMGQSTAILLCIWTFSAWWWTNERTTNKQGDPCASLHLTSSVKEVFCNNLYQMFYHIIVLAKTYNKQLTFTFKVILSLYWRWLAPFFQQNWNISIHDLEIDHHVATNEKVRDDLTKINNSLC